MNGKDAINIFCLLTYVFTMCLNIHRLMNEDVMMPLILDFWGQFHKVMFMSEIMNNKLANNVEVMKTFYGTS
jgi:hypothetical protein